MPARADAQVDVRADERGPGLQAYMRGRLAESQGAPGEASIAYRSALADDPGNIDIAQRSYLQALAAGDPALALQSARILDGQATLPADGVLLMLGDALGRGDWRQAAALIARIKSANFRFIAPIVESWLPKELIAPADPAIGRSLVPERYFPEQRLFQAFAIHDLAAVEMHLPIALGYLPDGGPGLRLVAASAFAEAGKKDRALALLSPGPTFAPARAALAAGKRARKDAPTPVTTAAQGYARLLTRMALDLTADRDKVVALRLARIAAFADPASAETRIAVARLLSANGQPIAALGELDKVPEASWFAPLAADARMLVLAQAGRTDEAVALARTRAVQPEAGTWAQVVLATMLDDANDAAGAAAAYADAIALYADGTAPWSLYLRQGYALDRSGDWPGAIVALKTAMKLAPNEPVVLNMLGYTQIKHRTEMADALVTLRKANRMRNNDVAILDSYGWALHLTGDLDGAVLVLERAATRAPSNGTIQEHLGDAYWAAGRRFEARYAWRRAELAAEEGAQERLTAKLEQGLLMANAAP